jgi:hypothetical protein
MKEDEVKESDWAILCYLLVKRLGGSAEFSSAQMIDASSDGKSGRLYFEEGFTPGSLRVIAKGN